MPKLVTTGHFLSTDFAPFLHLNHFPSISPIF